MENKNSSKRRATLDGFITSSKRSRDEENLNSSNQSLSSTAASSPSETRISIFPSSSNHSVTDMSTVNPTNSCLNNENSSSKSSSNGCPLDVSQSSKDAPCQPHLPNYPTDKENRSFQVKWYTDRPWLEYSVTADVVFCYCCRHFAQFSTPARNQRDAFTTCGFNNWKRALAKDRGFDKHVKSQTHITALANFLEYQSRLKSNTSVLNVLQKSHSEQVLYNRSKLIKICSAILLCAKQMIGLRGHDESINSNNRGNLIEILKWSAKTDPLARAVLEESAGNATYLSPQTQNELLHIMANQIRENIVRQVNENVYVLLADEATDVSHNKQLSICLRLVDDRCEIREFFMGFIRLHRFDAASLAKEISDFLSKHNIPFSMCIAQCYDGAAVMAGEQNGVHVILQKNFMPRAIYFHCMAHRLNLVICDVCCVVPYVDEFFSILSKIHQYFSASGVTNRYFREAQKLLELDTTATIKLWANTRWDSRFKSIDSVKSNYAAILQALQELINDGGSRAVDATGLLVVLKDSMFIITIFILHRLLGPIKILSDQLKGTSADLGSAQNLITAICEQLTHLRNEDSFKDLYQQALIFANQNDIDMNGSARARRSKTIPSRFKDCLIMTTVGHRDYTINEENLRLTMFFPTIDAILIELKERFSCHNLEIAKSVASLSPITKTFLDIEILEPLINHLSLEKSMVQNEISVIKHMIKDSKLSTVLDVLVELEPMQRAFPSTVALIKGAVTFPVSSVVCERTFSKMKLIKNYARNSMEDERLSDLSVLAVEKDFEIDFEKVVDVFAERHKNSRIMLS